MNTYLKEAYREESSPQCNTRDRKVANEISRDFIDTEHSSGDVNKMLLGSFVEAYDKDEGDEVEPQVSPYSPRSNGEREIFPTSNQVENGASMTGLRNGMQHLATGPDYQPNGSGALLLSNG